MTKSGSGLVICSPDNTLPLKFHWLTWRLNIFVFTWNGIGLQNKCWMENLNSFYRKLQVNIKYLEHSFGARRCTLGTKSSTTVPLLCTVASLETGKQNFLCRDLSLNRTGGLYCNLNSEVTTGWLLAVSSATFIPITSFHSHQSGV